MTTVARRAERVALALALLAGPLAAAELRVSPAGPETDLAAALARAAPGDTVRVAGGVYQGPFEVLRPVRLLGEGWPVLDGGGRGTVLALRAPGAEVRGFVVRDSGASLDQENSGIAVEAPGARVEGNRLERVLFGIYLRNAPGSTVRGNRIEGKALALARRGDAIRVWYSDRTVIADNEVAAARDVVLWYSSGLEVTGNRVGEGRYGLHFMYCDDATIRANLLHRNSVGAFLMYSRRLRLEGNTIAANQGPSGYGVGLKDMDDALVRGNLLVANRVGAFLDNSPREIGSGTRVEGNVVAGNDIGMLLLPNVRRAELRDNSFIENREQMALAGSGGDPEANLWLQNYWSDYAGFDADADGFGDPAYRAERLFESLSDRHPQLRVFLHSPAAGALDFAARAFPVVRPRPKLSDARPRMKPLLLATVPALPRSEGGAWAGTTAGILLSALLLVAAPRLVRSGGGRAPSPPAPGSAGPELAPLLSAAGLSVTFGDKAALRGVDFEIRPGESVSLWGPNGAGKTTALRALLGLVRCTGSVRVAGLDPRRRGKEARRRVGFVPQEIGFQGELEAEETLRFFARLRRLPDRRVEELLAWLGLEEERRRPVRALSGGQKQRLALGVALLADPPILLLDEPTANLDAAARGSLYELLGQLREQGKTLVFTSHRAEEVELLADRVLLLEDGRLVADGPPREVTGDRAPEVEIDLRLPQEQVAAALELLARAGFEARRMGPLVLVRVPARRKVEPVARLLEAGIGLEDFGVSRATGSGNGHA